MDGGIYMSKEQSKIYRLGQKVLNGNLSIGDFAGLIGKSYRQAQRIIKNIQNKDLLGLAHGNLGRSPVNKTPAKLEKDIIRLLRTKYSGFNLTHFREKILINEGIKVSKDTVQRIARKNNLSKTTQRRSKRVHKLRPRLPQEGMLLQFDGSEHRWFNGITTDLLLAIDDATGKIVNAQFFYGETSNNVMTVIKELIIKNGVPEAMYFDQAGIYGKKDREWESQISRALSEVDCRLILASTPQAKGRVERVFRTLQDRLISELKLQKIKCVNDANDFLKKIYIPNFNKQFAVEPIDHQKAYRSSKPYSLDRIFCKKESRKIGQGNTFGYKNQIWVIDENFNYNNRIMNINTHLDGTVTFEIMGRIVTAQRSIKNYRFIKRAA